MLTNLNKDFAAEPFVPEIELLQRIKESDFDAIRNLYDKYSPLIYTLVKKILQDNPGAEDLLIDFFSMIPKKINYIDFNLRSSYTWIITIARNKAVYELRIKSGMIGSSETENESIIPKISNISEPLELDKALRLKNKIVNAFNKLTNAQQYVIHLAFYEGLNQKEIAEKLKIPLSTVRLKIKTSLINLNENFTGKASLFEVDNENVEMIYPFVLGCLPKDEQIKTYNRFKASESFPWKLLGEYQNLVALLPVSLNIESPSEETNEKMLNRIYHLKSVKYQDKTKLFEKVTSLSSNIKDTKEEETYSKEEPDEKKSDEVASESREIKKKTDEYEPVIPFKPSIEEKQYLTERKSTNYSSILIIGLIVFYIASVIMAYLFYQDRTLFYEAEIENLNNRIKILNEEYRNLPVIPGLRELKNPKTIELINYSSPISSGEIIFSYTDKKGYLHIRTLPILGSDNAYQLWGNFNGNFVSLGVFKASSKPDYFPFTLPESIEAGPVEFYLIESNAEGSRRPGSKIYLKGHAE